MAERAELEKVLKSHGWELTPEFFYRYNNDPFVYNLTNALVAMHGPAAVDHLVDMGVLRAVKVHNLGHGIHCESHVGRPCDCTARDQTVYAKD